MSCAARFAIAGRTSAGSSTTASPRSARISPISQSRVADAEGRESRAVGEPDGAPLDPVAGDRLRVADAHLPRVLEEVGVEALARLEVLVGQARRAHPVEPEGALAVGGAVPGVDQPVREDALEGVRLDQALRRRLLTLLQIVDRDHAPLLDRVRERRDQLLLVVPGSRLGRLMILELAERLRELLAHPVERRVHLRGDRGADDVERQPDRASLERRQARRQAEDVAVQLLVDADRVALELGVDRVAAAAEVDEVEQREMLLQLLSRDVEARRQLVRVQLGVAALAAGGEQIGEERLQDGEALRGDGRRRALGGVGSSRPPSPARASAARPREPHGRAAAPPRTRCAAPAARAGRLGRSGAGPSPRAARSPRTRSRRRRR